MVTRIFSIFDVKANAYLPPFFLPEDAIAIRTFGDCVNDKTHAFGMHPEDYMLFYIGSFDNINSVIEPSPAPLLVHTGLELLGTSSEPPSIMESDFAIKPSTAKVKT